MRAVILAAISSLSLVGCVGELSTGPMGGDQGPVGDGTNPNPQGNNSVAKQMFDQNVFPIIAADWTATASGCAGAGCHEMGNSPTSTQFVAATPDEGWATINSFTALVGAWTPSTAALLTKVDASHQNRVYSAAERTAITDWLAKEAEERAGGTGPGPSTGTETPGQATARLMNAWSSCLTVTDFQSANMRQAWQNMTAGGSACETCHSTGAYNFIVSRIVETDPNGGPPGFYTTLATIKEYMIMWFTVDLTQTGPDGKRGKIVINEQAFIGVAEGKAPHATHPRFNALNNQGMTALREWYDLTMAKLTAAGATGNCGTTQLNPPAM